MRYIFWLLGLTSLAFGEWFGFSTGINIAKSRHKPLLVYIYQRNCDACKQMEMFTLSNKNVENIMNRFIVSSVDLDGKDGYIFKRQYGVFGTPTTLIINPYTKKPIFRIFGDQSANVFTKNLEYACKLSIKGGLQC